MEHEVAPEPLQMDSAHLEQQQHHHFQQQLQQEQEMLDLPQVPQSLPQPDLLVDAGDRQSTLHIDPIQHPGLQPVDPANPQVHLVALQQLLSAAGAAEAQVAEQVQVQPQAMMPAGPSAGLAESPQMPAPRRIVSEKVCNLCQKNKPASEYSRNPTSYDGLRSHCRDCLKLYRARTAVRAPMVSEKVCRLCKQQLPANAFSRKSSTADGLRGFCKVCDKGHKVDKVRTKRCSLCKVMKNIDVFQQAKKGTRVFFSSCCLECADIVSRLTATSASMGLKKCKRCGEDKDRTEYNRDCTKPDGLRAECKGCLMANHLAKAERLNTVTHKACKGCGQDLPVDKFWKKNNTRDGLMTRCVDCAKALAKGGQARAGPSRGGAEGDEDAAEEAEEAAMAARMPDGPGSSVPMMGAMHGMEGVGVSHGLPQTMPPPEGLSTVDAVAMGYVMPDQLEAALAAAQAAQAAALLAAGLPGLTGMEQHPHGSMQAMMADMQMAHMAGALHGAMPHDQQHLQQQHAMGEHALQMQQIMEAQAAMAQAMQQAHKHGQQQAQLHHHDQQQQAHQQHTHEQLHQEPQQQLHEQLQAHEHQHHTHEQQHHIHEQQHAHELQVQQQQVMSEDPQAAALKVEAPAHMEAGQGAEQGGLAMHMMAEGVAGQADVQNPQ